MQRWTLDLQGLASIATALGVLFAGWQLLLAKRQATTTFEDSLSGEFRAIAQRIPVRALLGEALTTEEAQATLAEFYHYVDLTNEQVFLRMNGRVTKATWLNWADGIASVLSRPAFKEAWQHIKQRAPDSFEELRRLEECGFQADPRSWRRTRPRMPSAA